MGIKQIFVVRHGETDYNVSGRWQGSLDIPLNAIGREQARLAAEALAGSNIGAVHSSDLSRALETAQIIAKGLHLKDVHSDARLRELHLGMFQGLTRQEIAETYPLEHAYWQNDDNYAVPKGGESRVAMQTRVYAFWQDMLTKETAENVLVVSHGGTIRWLMVRLFGHEAVIGRHFENTSITIVEKRDWGLELSKIGDVTHLESTSIRSDKKSF